jgi:hypothetical protein
MPRLRHRIYPTPRRACGAGGNDQEVSEMIRSTTEDTERTEGLKSNFFRMPRQSAIIVNGEDVDRLVHNSVDDLRTQIKFQKAVKHQPCLWTLKVAHEECILRGYKTKAKILAAAIKKQEAAK